MVRRPGGFQKNTAEVDMQIAQASRKQGNVTVKITIDK
jgi:hypothetical protein